METIVDILVLMINISFEFSNSIQWELTYLNFHASNRHDHNGRGKLRFTFNFKQMHIVFLSTIRQKMFFFF